jgi:acyl carrier protein
MSENVAEKVIATIAKSKKIPVETITLDSKFEELKIDSLDGLNLFFDLEEAFDITIPDDRARQMRTVREVVEALELLLSSQSAPPASQSAAPSE